MQVARGETVIPAGLTDGLAALDVILDFAFNQGMIPRRFSVDELFDEVTRNLTV